MSKIVDARGLSCPQPVLLTLKEIKGRASGEIVVLVDSSTSRENVCRAVGSQGWQVKNILAEGNDFRIIVAKGSI
jgi:tRNA 2-thiouridine synthesizing protein A